MVRTILIKTEAAIEYFGGRNKGGINKLARYSGRTHGAVSQWGEYVPSDLAYKLYVRTGGKIPAEERKSNVGKA